MYLIAMHIWQLFAGRRIPQWNSICQECMGLLSSTPYNPEWVCDRLLSCVSVKIVFLQVTSDENLKREKKQYLIWHRTEKNRLCNQNQCVLPCGRRGMRSICGIVLQVCVLSQVHTESSHGVSEFVPYINTCTEQNWTACSLVPQTTSKTASVVSGNQDFSYLETRHYTHSGMYLAIWLAYYFTLIQCIHHFFIINKCACRLYSSILVLYQNIPRIFHPVVCLVFFFIFQLSKKVWRISLSASLILHRNG